MKKDLSNHELVSLALFLLGGSTRPIDTEDVAKKADLLAPGRFTWKKYADQINLELIRVFLSDAKKEKNGALVDGSGSEGWQLTNAGQKRVTQFHKRSKSIDLSRESVSQKDKAWRKTERIRLLNSPAFISFTEGGVRAVTRNDADSFFRLDEYITGDARRRKIDRVLNAFAEDSALGKAVGALAKIALRT